MSLPDVITAVVEHVAQVVADTPDVPTPDRTLRYHGTRQMPQDCCTDNGYVVGSWEPIQQVDRLQEARRTQIPNSGWPQVVVVVNYVICWPPPDVGPGGVKTRDDDWDTAAARLAAVGETVSRSLIQISCRAQVPEAIGEQGCDSFSFMDCTPTGPGGGCAGLTFRSRVSLLRAPTVP